MTPNFFFEVLGFECNIFPVVGRSVGRSVARAKYRMTSNNSVQCHVSTSLLSQSQSTSDGRPPVAYHLKPCLLWSVCFRLLFNCCFVYGVISDSIKVNSRSYRLRSANKGLAFDVGGQPDSRPFRSSGVLVIERRSGPICISSHAMLAHANDEYLHAFHLVRGDRNEVFVAICFAPMPMAMCLLLIQLMR